MGKGALKQNCKTNRRKTRAMLYTDIRCVLLPKEWSMVDGPASAGSIDLYGLAMNLQVSYRQSHFLVIRCNVSLRRKGQNSSNYRLGHSSGKATNHEETSTRIHI